MTTTQAAFDYLAIALAKGQAVSQGELAALDGFIKKTGASLGIDPKAELDTLSKMDENRTMEYLDEIVRFIRDNSDAAAEETIIKDAMAILGSGGKLSAEERNIIDYAANTWGIKAE